MPICQGTLYVAYRSCRANAGARAHPRREARVGSWQLETVLTEKGGPDARGRLPAFRDVRRRRAASPGTADKRRQARAMSTALRIAGSPSPPVPTQPVNQPEGSRSRA